MTVERIKPDPIPAVYPLWEFQAEGELRDTYEAYKEALQVPWVGVVTMALAHYRPILNAWWDALQPVAETQAYVDAAFALRERVESKITALNPPPIKDRLMKLGYSARELDEIRDMVDVITHGNFIQIPAIFAARVLLEGGELNGGPTIGPKASAHRPAVTTPFVLMEPHHALGDLKSIYDDVKSTLGLPFVNTDYRCFSRWPSYFEAAWGDLRTVIPTDEYEAFVLDMHNAIAETTENLPNPKALTSSALKEAADADGKGADVLETIRLFSWLIPGLVTNVAYFRAQLLR